MHMAGTRQGQQTEAGSSHVLQMENRPRKQLSLKQRKLTFQSTSNELAQPQSQPTPAAKPPETITIEDNPTTTDPPTNDCIPSKNLPNGLLCLPFSGLRNLGNTCYVNSVLQVLRFCPTFCTSIVKMESGLERRDSSSSEEDVSTDTLSRHLSKVWQRMAHKEKMVAKPTTKVTTLSATKPDAFVAKLRQENQLFDNKSQHDAQEMLRFLLTNLHETYISRSPSVTPSREDEAPPTSTPSQSTPTPSHSSTPSHSAVSTPSLTPTILTPSHVNGTKVPKSLSTKKRKLDKLTGPFNKFLKLNSGKALAHKKLSSYFKAKDPEKENAEKTPPPEIITKTDDFIPSMFQGSLAYQTRCYECDNATRRSEHFLDVSVPVSYAGFPGFPPIASPIKAPSAGSSVVGPYSLSWCLSQFALREKLRGDNKYRCDECGRFTEAERSLLFSELPSVMTIHLNRFATQAWGHSASITVNKIRGNVSIPFALSFKPWTTEDCKGREKVYELFAIVFHSGSSCMSGHYTACVRVRECVEATQLLPTHGNEEAGLDPTSWLYFDDEYVKLLTQNELSSLLSPLSDNVSSAYVLFYLSH